MSVLSFMRWAENYHLFILGALSFASAYFGRAAARRRWQQWARIHLTGMGASYNLHAHGILRGQRQEPTPVEGVSANCVLVAAGRDRLTADPPCPLSAPSDFGARSPREKSRTVRESRVRANRQRA